MEAAVNYMKEHGWNRGQYVGDEGQVCAAGAIILSLWPKDLSGEDNYSKEEYCDLFPTEGAHYHPDIVAALADLARMLGMEVDRPDPDEVGEYIEVIGRWNDFETDESAVLEMLEAI